jgi:NAD(P)-dependent dehydrogenase (short-subunit alcohol dehydrogenase family)
MALPLEGKVAIVTGSSRGIGKAIALQLAKDGADVAISARVETPIDGRPGWSLEETAATIQALGHRVLPIKMDVTSDTDLKYLVDRVMAAYGRIDIVVNNAARMGGGEPFLGGSTALFDEFIDTNLRAPYVLTQIAGQLMAATGGGAIINITSAGAHSPPPPTGRDAWDGRGSGVGIGYGIAKAGLDRWAAGVALELKSRSIAIVNVDPGLTVTERNQLNPRPGVDYSRADPPEVTAKAIAFICRNPMPYTGRVVVAREVVKENNL